MLLPCNPIPKRNASIQMCLVQPLFRQPLHVPKITTSQQIVLQHQARGVTYVKSPGPKLKPAAIFSPISPVLVSRAKTTTFFVTWFATATLEPSLFKLKWRGFSPPEAVRPTNSSLPALVGLKVTSESLLIMVLFVGSGFGTSKMGPRRLEAMMKSLSGVYAMLVYFLKHGIEFVAGLP
jgi:hypothetical protein